VRSRTAARAEPGLIEVRAERRILLVRGHKVLVDSDLAALYEVPTRRLNEQVRRNLGRFPPDFMFVLTNEEAAALRSQSATSKGGRGGRRYPPMVFTEQGVAMLSSVLRSPRAIQVNVGIIRAFVKLREMLASHQGLAHKLEELERKYDAQFRVVLEAIRDLLRQPASSTRRIGFGRGEK
jgi:hypothetical protein